MPKKARKGEIMSEEKFSLGRLFITVFIVAVTAITVAGSVYLVVQNQADRDKQELQNQINELRSAGAKSTTEPTATTESNLKTYSSSVYGFSLKYPKTWTLTDNLPNPKPNQSSSDQALEIKSPDNMSFVLYVNPAGWGMEGASRYVDYNAKITSGSPVLTRTGDESSTWGDGSFIVSTNFKNNQDNYSISIKAGVSSLTSGEAAFKDIVESMTFN